MVYFVSERLLLFYLLWYCDYICSLSVSNYDWGPQGAKEEPTSCSCAVPVSWLVE